MYESTSAPSGTISRLHLLPFPVQTRKLRLSVLGDEQDDAQENVLVRLDLLGMTTKDRYEMNPFLDEIFLEHGMV